LSVLIDWDIEEYIKLASHSRSRLPRPALGHISVPATILDKRGRIILWYLPGILLPSRQVFLTINFNKSEIEYSTRKMFLEQQSQLPKRWQRMSKIRCRSKITRAQQNPMDKWQGNSNIPHRPKIKGAKTAKPKAIVKSIGELTEDILPHQTNQGNSLPVWTHILLVGSPKDTGSAPASLARLLIV
jgi:hypothetical protein